jgi:hypothetical protein
MGRDILEDPDVVCHITSKCVSKTLGVRLPTGFISVRTVTSGKWQAVVNLNHMLHE